MMLTDTHCHLDFSDFDADREAVVERAIARGVKRLVSIGTDLDRSRAAIALAEKYPQVYAVVGIHPNEASAAPANFCHELEKMAAHPKVVGLGECGLDYHYLPSLVQKDSGKSFEMLAQEDVFEKKRQAEVFIEQLDLAAKLGLNLVVHQRDSWEDTLRLLLPYHGKVRTVFHCFGGTMDQANELLAQNHLVSFTGIVTFKNGKQVQETASALRPGTFMVETDCPYLSPVPYRGKRCEPAFTREVAEKLAELRGISLEDLARMTEQVADSFFRFQK